jgi:hypothetical protein
LSDGDEYEEEDFEGWLWRIDIEGGSAVKADEGWFA